MARLLRYIGIVLLSLTAGLLMAGSVGWLSDADTTPWIWTTARAGAVCLGAGVLLALLSPLGRELRRGRCVRCGVAIERRQTYCADHLQEAVNQYRDEQHDGLKRRPGGR
jgi:hypothetical protein